MRLPELDQILELKRGEAAELNQAIVDVVLRVLEQLQAEEPYPLPAGLFVALPALTKLTGRLSKVARSERMRRGLPSKKPHRFCLSYVEVAALMCYVLPVATTARVPLGNVQQQSLNLEQIIDFT